MMAWELLKFVKKDRRLLVESRVSEGASQTRV
jgi:hypothetical protein